MSMDLPSSSSSGGCRGSCHRCSDCYVSDSISKSKFVPNSVFDDVTSPYSPDPAETRRVESIRVDVRLVVRSSLSAPVEPLLLVGAVPPIFLQGSSMKEEIIRSAPPVMNLLLDSETTTGSASVPSATTTAMRRPWEHESDDSDDRNNAMLYALIPGYRELYRRRKRL